MQHTVIAFFDTYPQAEVARDALVAAGIARENVTLQAKCEPTFASDATSAYEAAPAANEGLLANIERFFESLFESVPPQRERAHYAEAVRRGAVMICVDAATDPLARITRATLDAMGPLDIEERAATWSPPADEATRSHSPLEELGLRSSVPVRPLAHGTHGTVYSYARDGVVEPAPGERLATEAAATAVAAGSAPGMGAVFTSGRTDSASAPAAAPAPAREGSTSRPPAVPDEYLQNEETFHGDEPSSKTR
ncbi:hypothetical protein [Trinickia dinghuensis]|nr:hypothetical protein [Trinickia dinghuensis]